VRAGGVHILPANVSLLSGALTEPLAVAVRAVVERGHLQAGERVAVIGPGTVGLLVAQVARAQGATVMLVGLAGHRQRFRLAAELGINSTLVLDDPASAAEVDAAGGTMDLVFECSGAVAALERASRLVGKGGRVVLIGFFGTKVTLDLDSIINREVSLVASRGKRPTSFHMALELMASGQVDPGRLITRRFPLEAWQAAFEAAHELGSKVVLEV
jgi:L-iditol 2-dehydrogenase